MHKSNGIAFSICVLLVSLSPLVLVSASAQEPSPFPTVSGQYSNSVYGVQITFPDGWKGPEITAQWATTVVVTWPQPPNPDSAAEWSMGLTMQPKSNSFPFNLDPNIPTDDRDKCVMISQDDTTVNGMSGVVRQVQCIGPTADFEEKYYTFQTDQAMIYLSYQATPPSLYDNNVGTFDSAVNTLQIANAVEAQSVPSTDQSSASNATTPEFPASAGIVMAVIIGLVILVTRTRFSLNFGNSYN